uniref:Uncharacterized LOC100179141 n=1 Tax=Ciona intestinalis TaxID=7719 RepID=F6PHA1_CIOIN
MTDLVVPTTSDVALATVSTEENCLPGSNNALLLKMDEILQNQKIITKLLQSSTPETDDCDLEEPMVNMKQFQDFEKKLEVKGYRKRLVNSLSGIGGCSASEVIRRMMAMLGTVNLWSQFSYKGRNAKKKAFYASFLNKMILKASKKILKTCSIKELEYNVSEVLKHAPHKRGGPKFKENPSDESNTSFDTEPYLSSSSCGEEI